MNGLPGLRESSSGPGGILHQNDHRQITFEDLGIRPTVSFRSSVFGNVRTLASLRTIEWVLLIGGLISLGATFALAVDRLFVLSPGSSEYVFDLVLILNVLFSIIYILDGIFREQAFEVLAFSVTSFIVIIYIVINFVQSTSSSTTFKLVRLILTSVLCTSVGVLAAGIAVDYWRSGNLIFRLVGADSTIQSMCRKLFTAVTLILFDAQLVGSVLVLALHNGITKLDLYEVLTLTIGGPWVFAWATIAYLAVRLESKYFFSLSVMLSPGHVAYILFVIVQNSLKHRTDIIANCRYAAGSAGLLVHGLLLYFLIGCYRNFGLGLKEKVYPQMRPSRDHDDLLR